jgi:DNA gyrase subunit A
VAAPAGAAEESGERLVPRRLDLKEMLRQFLDFRFLVVTRRLKFELRTLEARIHILEGLARVFEALDEAIALIRAAEDRAAARAKLRQRFELSEEQAEAVLEIRLYRLARLEIQAILEELSEKQRQAARLRRLLRGKQARWELVRTELAELDRLYRDPRRTAFDVGGAEEASYREDAYLVDEDARVIVTRDGWLKRQKSYTELAAIRVREGDAVQWAYPARTKEVVLLFSNRGRVYTARVSDLQQTSGYGEPVHRRFDLADGEVLVGVVVSDPRALPPVSEEERAAAQAMELPPPPYVVAVTRGGACLRLSVSAFSDPSNRKGRVYARLDPAVPDDAVVRVLLSEECDEETIAVATGGGRAIIFYVDEIKVLKGPGRGVRAIKLESFDRVLDFALATRARDGLAVQTPRGRQEIIRTTKYAPTRRGGKGRVVVRRGKLTALPSEPVEVRADGGDDGGCGGAGASGAGPTPAPREEPRAEAESAAAGGDRAADVVADAVDDVSESVVDDSTEEPDEGDGQLELGWN